MKDIYQKVAKDCGISVENLKQEIQSCIDEAYLSQNKSRATKLHQDMVPRQGGIPSTEELLRFLIKKIEQGYGKINKDS